MISGGMEINYFAEIHVIVEGKYGDDPLLSYFNSDIKMKCNTALIS